VVKGEKAPNARSDNDLSRSDRYAARGSAVLSCVDRKTGIGFAGFFGQSVEARRPMAQHCDFCGKTPMSGHRVSHAHNVTNRKWHLNLKTVRAVIGGVSRRASACTRCIRSGKVKKPIPRSAATAAPA
jgi:large subunit ribosomal protein L28